MENNDDDDENDSDLEAELAAITSGGAKQRPKPRPKPQVAPSDLDKMVAESLRDIPSDEELSGDDDDPDLLNELSNIAGLGGSPEEPVEESPEEAVPESPEKQALVPSPPKDEIFVPTTTLSTADVIKTRIQMYKEAESNAKAANDSTRARRFGRGLKSLEALLKQANAGKPINMDEIPPEVAVKPGQNKPAEVTPTTGGSGDASTPVRQAPPPPASVESHVESIIAPDSPASQSSPTAPTSPSVTSAAPAVNESKINALLSRQKEYKIAALTSKKAGDTATALQYVKILKIFEQVLTAARAGEPVDLSDMPPPPSELSLADLAPKPAVVTQPEPVQPTKQEAESQNATDQPATEEGLITPTTILEGLVQRLEKYKSVEQSAKDEGNSSKARRLGRIVKQYEDAVKQCKAGKAVAYDDLPTPPGFGPLPIPGGAVAKPAAPAAPAAPAISASPPVRPPPVAEKATPPARPPLQKQDSRVSGNHSSTSLMSKTIEILLQRQKEYKDAALTAKKAGEIEQAKEYLRIYKGFDSLLDTARGGLPVDLSTVSVGK